MSMRPAPPPPGPSGQVARLLGIITMAVVAGLVLSLMVLPLVGGVGIAARNAAQAFQSLPADMETPPLPEQTRILAADGSELATLFYENRIEVPLSRVAPVMRQAVVAVEDSRYLDHNGVDLRGALRAVARNTSSGGVQEGASTLTMQYVKNVLVSQAENAEELDAARGDNTIRKLREMRYALALERRFTKAEILERYLNIVYFGAGAHGIEAAAQRYFSTPASDLTLVEAATLAGIVQQPVSFDPLRSPERSEARRNVVLDRMAKQNFITNDEAAAAKAVPMAAELRPSVIPNGCTTSYAPFFCDYVLQDIRRNPLFGDSPASREAFLRRGGYTITTTLNTKAQEGAFTAVTDMIPIADDSKRAAAISMVQPGTGNILAMAQNRKWGTSGKGATTYNYNVNRDMGGTAGMQAGSTFKIFTLAAALDQGITPSTYISSPSTGVFKDFVNCETGAKFPPVTVRNSTSSGTFDMARATAYSVNTFFMGLEQMTGLCRPVEIAESMGVTKANGEPLERVPSFTLGSMEVVPLSVANAFATFAAHGLYCPPRSITAVVDRDGKALPLPPPQCTQVLTRDVADSTTALLTGVIDGYISGRTGQNMALPDRAAAGKTGTTNENAAVWFSGFTPDIASSVWVGDPRGGFAYPMTDVTINGRYYSEVFGSTMPGPIWKQAMEAATAGTLPTDFDLQSSWGLRPARNATSYARGYRPSVQLRDESVTTFEKPAVVTTAPQAPVNADEVAPTTR